MTHLMPRTVLEQQVNPSGSCSDVNTDAYDEERHGAEKVDGNVQESLGIASCLSGSDMRNCNLPSCLPCFEALGAGE